MVAQPFDRSARRVWQGGLSCGLELVCREEVEQHAQLWPLQVVRRLPQVPVMASARGQQASLSLAAE